jgi:hypothetical protein
MACFRKKQNALELKYNDICNPAAKTEPRGIDNQKARQALRFATKMFFLDLRGLRQSTNALFKSTFSFCLEQAALSTA